MSPFYSTGFMLRGLWSISKVGSLTSGGCMRLTELGTAEGKGLCDSLRAHRTWLMLSNGKGQKSRLKEQKESSQNNVDIVIATERRPVTLSVSLYTSASNLRSLILIRERENEQISSPLCAESELSTLCRYFQFDNTCLFSVLYLNRPWIRCLRPCWKKYNRGNWRLDVTVVNNRLLRCGKMTKQRRCLFYW